MSTLGWLVPLAFLPLLSPWRTALGFLWILPLFASARFSSGYLPTFHYGAPLFPFLLLASGTAATRFRDHLMRLVDPVVIAASAALSLVVFNPFASWIWDVRSPAPAEAAEGLRHLKSTDRVTATSTLAAHLSHRVLLLPFPYPFMQGDEPTPLDRSVTRVGLQLVASIDAVAIYMGEDASSLKVRQAFIRLPALQEFRLVFDRGGVLIYRRAGSTPSS